MSWNRSCWLLAGNVSQMCKTEKATEVHRDILEYVMKEVLEKARLPFLPNSHGQGEVPLMFYRCVPALIPDIYSYIYCISPTHQTVSPRQWHAGFSDPNMQ